MKDKYVFISTINNCVISTVVNNSKINRGEIVIPSNSKWTIISVRKNGRID